MFKIAICDDMEDQKALIQGYVDQYVQDKKITDARCRAFSSSFLLLEDIEKHGGYDCLLLDICIPGIMGTDIAEEVRRRQDKTDIIFLTTSHEFAVEAFSLGAVHYLVKPFSTAQFDEAMDRVMNRRRASEQRKLSVKLEGRIMQVVHIDEISYVESDAHIQNVYMDKGICLRVRDSMAHLFTELEKLAVHEFVMPYKGYIVNQNDIKMIRPGKIILRDGKEIPINKGNFRKLQETYFEFIFSH